MLECLLMREADIIGGLIISRAIVGAISAPHNYNCFVWTYTRIYTRVRVDGTLTFPWEPNEKLSCIPPSMLSNYSCSFCRRHAVELKLFAEGFCEDNLRYKTRFYTHLRNSHSCKYLPADRTIVEQAIKTFLYISKEKKRVPFSERIERINWSKKISM